MTTDTIDKSVRTEAETRLRRILRIGEVFVDGDAFKRLIGLPELNTGDTYYVQHEEFISLKQTLFKLKRVEEGDIGVIGWRKFKDEADICLPIDSTHRSVRPGNYPITDAMAAAFAGEVGVEEREMRGYPILCLFGPIRDSHDDVVGIIEVFASLVPDAFKVDQLNH